MALEGGKTLPSFELACRLADSLGVSEDEDKPRKRRKEK
jgi:hypothetical protein